jgi:hypothetical protein
LVALSLALGNQVFAQQSLGLELPGIETWSCDGTSRWEDTAEFRYQVIDQTGQPRIVETISLKRTGDDKYYLPLELTSLPKGRYKVKAFQKMPICLSYELSASEELYTADFLADIPNPLYWPEGQANWARNPVPVKSACCTWVQNVVIAVAVLLLLVSPILIVLAFWPRKNWRYRLKCLIGGLSAFVAMLFLTGFVSIMTGPIEQSTETITRSFSFEADASDIAPGQHLFSETLEGFQNAYANVQATHISETAHMYAFLPTGETGFALVSKIVDKVYLATAPPIRDDRTFAVAVSVRNKFDEDSNYQVTLECKRENQVTFNETVEVDVPPEAYKTVEFKLAHVGAGKQTCSSGGKVAQVHVFEAPYLALLKPQHTLDIGQPLVVEGNTNLGSDPYSEALIKVGIRPPSLKTYEKEKFAVIDVESGRFAVEFGTDSLTEGVYQIVVADDTESLSEQADLELIRRYHDIRVSALKLDPVVFVGDKTNGLLSLKNAGNDSGIFPAEIRLDGRVVMSAAVNVGAGQLLEIPVRFSVATSGEYVVRAGEMLTSLIVRAVPKVEIEARSSIETGEEIEVLGTSNLKKGDTLKVELCSTDPASWFCAGHDQVPVDENGGFRVGFPTLLLTQGLYDIAATHSVRKEAKDIQSIQIYSTDSPKSLEYAVSLKPDNIVDAGQPVYVEVEVHNRGNTSIEKIVQVTLNRKPGGQPHPIELPGRGKVSFKIYLGPLEPGNYRVDVDGWKRWLRVLEPLHLAQDHWVFSDEDIHVKLGSTVTRLNDMNRSFKLTASVINKSNDDLLVNLILDAPPGFQLTSGTGCALSTCTQTFRLTPGLNQKIMEMFLSVSQGTDIGKHIVKLEFSYKRPGDTKPTTDSVEGYIYYSREP